MKIALSSLRSASVASPLVAALQLLTWAGPRTEPVGEADGAGKLAWLPMPRCLWFRVLRLLRVLRLPLLPARTTDAAEHCRRPAGLESPSGTSVGTLLQ